MNQDTSAGQAPPANPQAAGIRDTAISFASELGRMALLLVAQVLLARFLEPAGRGSYAVCNVFGAVLTVICFLGTDVGFLYFIGSRKFSISEGVASTFLFALVCSAAAIGLGLLLVRMPWEFFSKASPTAFYLALASVPIVFLDVTLVRCLPQLRQFTWYGLLTALEAVLYTVNVVVFVRVLDGGVNGALIGVMVTSGLVLLAALGVLRWKCGLTWIWPSWRRLKEILHYGVRYYFGKISNLVNFQVGTLLLAALAPEAEIGLFSLALAMAVRIEVIPAALTTVLFSRVAADAAGRAELVAQCVRITAVVVGLLLAVGALAAYPFFALALPQYMPAVAVLWLLMPGEWIRSAAKLFVPYFAGTDRPGIASAAVALGLATNVVLLLVLMPLWRINGVALSVTASYVVSSVFLAVAFRRASGLGYWQTWCFKRADWNVSVEAVRSLWRRCLGGIREPS